MIIIIFFGITETLHACIKSKDDNCSKVLWIFYYYLLQNKSDFIYMRAPSIAMGIPSAYLNVKHMEIGYF